MSLDIGSRVGPYEILAPIGAGGMGEVYRAHDTKLGRDVALKVLPEAFAHDGERMARFEREAHVLASLNHPNIATIYGFEAGALAMELVEGPTLAERIGGRAMPLDEALPIAKQIAEGLEYAHERGVVHRDLKPANAKLTADGNVKILDFGLAKALETPTPQANPSISPTLTLEGTRAGVILGTAAYMAPEQARGAVVDKRADIWAFGVVLYEVLTGKQPFAGATVSDTLAAVLRAEPDWDAIPAGMRRLVRRCLEKDPKRRLRDIGEARLAIEEPDVAPIPSSKRAVLWKVAAGVLSVALAVALWAPWRKTQPASQPLMRLSVEYPEFAGGSVILSPDGRRILYSGWAPDGKRHLFIRVLDQEQSTPLSGTDGADGPFFFSPDGQFVGFFAGRNLKKVVVQGGASIVLCEIPEGRGGSWGEDGNIITTLHRGSGLYRVSSDGGPVQPVTALNQEKKERTHRWPQVLPGARAVLFTASTALGDFEQATIEAQSLTTGERKTLILGGYYGRYVRSGHLLFVRQRTLYAAPMDVERLEITGKAVPVVEEVESYSDSSGGAVVDVSESGTLVYVRGKEAQQTLVWLDSSGHTQPLRATVARYVGTPRFSPDGRRLALVMSESGNSDVWVYEWERDTTTRFTSTPGVDGWPVWSPSGRHIVFTSGRAGGGWNLYWMRADGAGEPLRLTESKESQFPHSFSPDGKRLVFAETNPQTNFDLWTLPLEEVESDHPKPGKPEPFLVTPFYENFPKISPDGRWVAYDSNDSGQVEVYVRPFPGPGGKWRISTGGGSFPVWSTKRPELFYGSSEGIMVASYVAKGNDFVPGKPRLWAEKKDLGNITFDLSPDGKRFAVVQTEVSAQKTPTRVTFLLNFFDELQRRAPAHH